MMADHKTFREIARINPGNPVQEVHSACLELVFDGDGIVEHMGRLSAEARLVYLVYNLEGDVHSGGFDSVFSFSLGSHCAELLASLKLLEASNSLALLKRAMSCFPGGIVPKDRKKCENIWYPISQSGVCQAKLGLCDQEFYKCEDGLTGRLNDYIRSHPTATIGNAILKKAF